MLRKRCGMKALVSWGILGDVSKLGTLEMLDMVKEYC